MLTVSAYAKINFTLEVLRKRDDGYHQIVSVMQTVEMADTFSFEVDEEIRFICNDIPGVHEELLATSIMEAAQLIRNETGYTGGAKIHLEKLEIPRACGLGSSSTDCAAVLKALNVLWSLDLSLYQLITMAAKLGSDTPFFIRGGTALVEGRGEEITPLPPPDPIRLFLVKPAINVPENKTARMYQALDGSSFSEGTKTNRMVFDLIHRKPLNPDMIYNTFDSVSGGMFPGLEVCRRQCEQAGMAKTRLAGSGPAFFSLVTEGCDSSSVMENLAQIGVEAYLMKTT